MLHLAHKFQNLKNIYLEGIQIINISRQRS